MEVQRRQRCVTLGICNLHGPFDWMNRRNHHVLRCDGCNNGFSTELTAWGCWQCRMAVKTLLFCTLDIFMQHMKT